MPAKLRAGGAFPYILEEDREIVSQPQFQIKILSVDDNESLNELRQSYVTVDRGDLKKRNEIAQQALDLTVASYSIPEWDGPLFKLLTERECWELINAATSGASLTADERKKFVSPPQSATGSCASDVEPIAKTD